MKAKINCINNIIETSYKISSYVEQYEQFKKQSQSATMLQNITQLMMPEFNEFIKQKFPQKEEQEEEQAPDKKNK